ncbi:MAG: DegV family protein [Clostridiales bacterium]|nr:DegV family protein [Clostridiales bacterium]
MGKIKIIADSTCDLGEELIKKYDITVLPLSIVLGDEAYQDIVEISPDEIYAWSDKNNTTPKTSSPTIQQVISTFKPIINDGDEIIAFSISEDMSTTANVMRLAAAELEAEDKVTVIDSMNLSTGIALQIIKAWEMVEEGMSREYIEKSIKELQPLVRASFVADTLTYLHRGGRCSATAALFGNALQLKPKIVVENGKMEAANKYRGKQDKVILKYVKDMESDIHNADSSRVFITHSGCDDKVIQAVYDYLKELGVFEEILITRAGGVISSHCGYGTLGVLYIVQNNNQD